MTTELVDYMSEEWVKAVQMAHERNVRCAKDLAEIVAELMKSERW